MTRGTLRLAVAVALALPAAALAQSAEERLAACVACHDAGGDAATPETPLLAGQPADYLLVQLFLFREGLRPSEVMAPMAEGLSDAELQDLAAHFAALEPAPPAPRGELDPEAYARGREVSAEHRCASCHLRDFSGRDQVPRLAGQREDYLVKSLEAYKSGTRPGYEPAMAEVMATVPASAIPDLAHYLAHFDGD